MKRNKQGVIHIETETEAHNFLRMELSSDKIRARAKARNKDRMISYHSPKTAMGMCLEGISRIETRKHREGKILLTTIVRCAMKREQLAAMADSTKNMSQKHYYVEQAKTLTIECIYQHYIKEWGYTLEKIKQIEKKTLEAIGDKLSLILSPITVSESIRSKLNTRR